MSTSEKTALSKLILAKSYGGGFQWARGYAGRGEGCGREDKNSSRRALLA